MYAFKKNPACLRAADRITVKGREYRWLETDEHGHVDARGRRPVGRGLHAEELTNWPSATSVHRLLRTSERTRACATAHDIAFPPSPEERKKALDKQEISTCSLRREATDPTFVRPTR